VGLLSFVCPENDVCSAGVEVQEQREAMQRAARRYFMEDSCGEEK
jgi:hypothetical protein